MRDSINISLKLYFNIKVKGDFIVSTTKISTDGVSVNKKSQVPNSNYTSQTEDGLPVAAQVARPRQPNKHLDSAITICIKFRR